ncbi:hypothetical protein AB0175_19660 [Klebsiella pneumoniae]|uniref:Uncharacterized protein n=1 Tax=Klebsiella pneumoniae subsp. ozaenae TaxID=574 RepID=A0A378ALJ5_KLEPO|nr:hypothetical protein [Klebsiella pneumoniae subsp. ozaenae]STV13593.1 Uncharacterised protein [Klebsiella pneumoniae subsp. ozaenae]HBY9797291.1 hypothetical protein [Klebsiella pneumoniae]HDH0769307.1 hypothetical protein [Klebsiella pneumoniae]
MDLQAWDNIISIASNAVTALGVVGGVVFGGSKLKDYLDVKKNDVAFQTALALYDEFDALRKKHLKIRVNINVILNHMDESFEGQHPITANKYFELQRLGIDSLDDSLSITRLVIKADNFNTLFNTELHDKIIKISDLTNSISKNLDNFFNLTLNSLKNRVVQDSDIDKAHTLCEEYEELTLQCHELCSDIKEVKFKDFCKFT